MSKRSAQIIAVIFGIIALYFTAQLIPDKTNRDLTAFSKQYSFEKELNITEKFTTDFESSYAIYISLENPDTNSMKQIQRHLELYHNKQPVKVYGDDSFLSEAGTEYDLKLKFVNENSKPNQLNITIQINVPGPIYDLYFEREFKWVYWTIDGVLILISLICGYFGFRKNKKLN